MLFEGEHGYRARGVPVNGTREGMGESREREVAAPSGVPLVQTGGARVEAALAAVSTVVAAPCGVAIRAQGERGTVVRKSMGVQMMVKGTQQGPQGPQRQWWGHEVPKYKIAPR